MMTGSAAQRFGLWESSDGEKFRADTYGFIRDMGL